jgi:ketosteroid isomerase-like protein
MTAQPAVDAGVAVVRDLFAAVSRGDVAALGDIFHPDATWNHRNEDRFAGVHRGMREIGPYLGASAELTAGTLHPTPQAMLADGAGHVAVVVHLTATRPDGRALDDTQVLLVTVESGRVRSIEQFVGDPRAVAAFWA